MGTTNLHEQRKLIIIQAKIEKRLLLAPKTSNAGTIEARGQKSRRTEFNRQYLVWSLTVKDIPRLEHAWVYNIYNTHGKLPQALRWLFYRRGYKLAEGIYYKIAKGILKCLYLFVPRWFFQKPTINSILSGIICIFVYYFASLKIRKCNHAKQIEITQMFFRSLSNPFEPSLSVYEGNYTETRRKEQPPICLFWNLPRSLV